MSINKILLFLAIGGIASADIDTFGITQLYPTKPGTINWTSMHWNNGISRTVQYNDDPYDPTGWTEDHSSETNGFFIDGNGTMTMSGGGPRFHINSLDTIKKRSQFFKNIEVTAFYQRKGSAGKNWGGMVVGVRSGPLGHASANGNDCDATTYYARFRNDGKWDFEKELKHPGSSYWSGSGLNHQDPLWGNNPLPPNRWIGMKFIVYTIENDNYVRLELYIDSTSHGNPSNGGVWKSVGTVTDAGDWPSGDVSGCGYDEKKVITQGNGTILMRTDGDTAIYKFVSVREVVPAGTASKKEPFTGVKTSPVNRHIRKLIATCREPVPNDIHCDVFTIQGKRLGAHAIKHLSKSTGIYILRDFNH